MSHSFQTGDTFTVSGIYYRRSLWQWLMRKPRKPAVWRVL